MNLLRILRIHRVIGPLALATVSLFFTATIAAELSGSHEAIRAVKRAIVLALPAMVLFVAGGAASGRQLGRKFKASPLLTAKSRRMPFIVALGLLVMLPSAVALDQLAQRDELGLAFMAIQAVELLGGFTNFVLLLLMARDGRAMASARRAQQARAAIARSTRALPAL
jgi:hypothetical protein